MLGEKVQNQAKHLYQFLIPIPHIMQGGKKKKKKTFPDLLQKVTSSLERSVSGPADKKKRK